MVGTSARASLIPLLMILWGTVVSSWPIERARDGWKAWALNFSGVALALYLFMADSIRVAHGGVDALRNVLPQSFNWPLFCVALVLMAAPIVQLLWSLREAIVQTKFPTLVDGDWEYRTGIEDPPSSKALRRAGERKWSP